MHRLESESASSSWLLMARRLLLGAALALVFAPPPSDGGGAPTKERRKAASVFEKLLASKKSKPSAHEATGAASAGAPAAGAAAAAGYASCESCVAAGHGWSNRKDLCGNYANRDCPPTPPTNLEQPARLSDEGGCDGMEGGLASVLERPPEEFARRLLHPFNLTGFRAEIWGREPRHFARSANQLSHHNDDLLPGGASTKAIRRCASSSSFPPVFPPFPSDFCSLSSTFLHFHRVSV